MQIEEKKKVLYPNLAAEMARNGDKTRDVASLLGITRSAVNSKMNGLMAWTQKQIDILCEHYDKTYEELFKGKGAWGKWVRKKRKHTGKA